MRVLPCVRRSLPASESANPPQLARVRDDSTLSTLSISVLPRVVHHVADGRGLPAREKSSRRACRRWRRRSLRARSSRGPARSLRYELPCHVAPLVHGGVDRRAEDAGGQRRRQELLLGDLRRATRSAARRYAAHAHADRERRRVLVLVDDDGALPIWTSAPNGRAISPIFMLCWSTRRIQRRAHGRRKDDVAGLEHRMPEAAQLLPATWVTVPSPMIATSPARASRRARRRRRSARRPLARSFPPPACAVSRPRGPKSFREVRRGSIAEPDMRRRRLARDPRRRGRADARRDLRGVGFDVVAPGVAVEVGRARR